MTKVNILRVFLVDLATFREGGGLEWLWAFGAIFGDTNNTIKPFICRGLISF